MEFGKTLVNLPKSFRRSIRDNVKTKSKGLGSGDDNLSKVTYEELVYLRDNAKLIPGRKYRIIDFVTTVGEVIGIYLDVDQHEHEYIKYASANHPFDIVVTALDVDKLDEVASCLLHEGDTYFSHVNISAWEIKYCLDNDTNRFEWADPYGKGVIYYMKDDRNNECDYDFKNVLFWRCYVEDEEGNEYYIGLADYIGGSAGAELPAINRNDYTYIYTFSIRGNLDASNNDFYNDASVVSNSNVDYGISCNNNIIKNNIINTIIDGIEHKCSCLPNITIVNIDSTYEFYSNVIQNSTNLVFTSNLINSSITGSAKDTYFFVGFINLNVSGNIEKTYFGFSDDYPSFNYINYIINATITGFIGVCNMFDYNTGSSDFVINAYICYSNIKNIRNVQFYGHYSFIIIDDIQNSYINCTSSYINFNTLINSNIQGDFNHITFNANTPLQATINLWARNSMKDVNIRFNKVPSNQNIIIAEIVGISSRNLPSINVNVSLTPEDNVLVPKLSILINEDKYSVTRYQV